MNACETPFFLFYIQSDLFMVSQRIFTRLAEPDNLQDVFRSRSSPLLMPCTMHELR